MKKTKGILLLAFGKAGYGHMAVHMAASIKYYNPEINITVKCDGQCAYVAHKYKRVFDKIEMIPDKYLFLNGKMNPGHCKLSIPHMLPYDTTLYLDVDGIATQDLYPILENDSPFSAILVGSGGISDVINYMFWASNADAWEHFEIDPEGAFYALQTSAMLFNKGPELEAFKSNIDHYNDFPLSKLSNQWGGCIPDELIYSGVTSKLKHNPDFGKNVVFFGHNYKMSLVQAVDQYPVISMYGAGNLVKLRFKDYYDRHAVNVMRKFGYNRIANIHYLSKQKHVA